MAVGLATVAGKSALKYGPAVLGALGILGGRPKGKRADIGAINQKYAGMRPEGYVGAGDLALSERNLGRANEVIGAGAIQAKQSAARRLQARGIVGPAQEQVNADIEQGAAQARVGAARNSADILDRIRLGNQQFEQNKAFAGWGAEIGDAMQRNQQLAGQQSTYWNSILGLARDAMPLLPGLSKPGTVAPTTTAAVDRPGLAGDAPH